MFEMQQEAFIALNTVVEHGNPCTNNCQRTEHSLLPLTAFRGLVAWAQDQLSVQLPGLESKSCVGTAV